MIPNDLFITVNSENKPYLIQYYESRSHRI